MKTKPAILIFIVCMFCFTFKLQGLVTYAPLEFQALDADYVVIGKFISSTEIKVSEDRTYSLDKFQLEKILIQNIHNFTCVNRSFIFTSETDVKPNPEKIFCVFRLSDIGVIRPNIKDPEFKKGVSYFLVIKYLSPDKNAGMYTPLHAYQGFPLATKEFVSEFMEKYKKRKQDQDKSIKLAARIRAKKIKEESLKTKPKPKPPKILGKIITVPGVIVKGAVLFKHLENTYYKKKCLHCGNVDVTTFGCHLQPAPWILNVNYKCYECGKISRGSITRESVSAPKKATLP